MAYDKEKSKFVKDPKNDEWGTKHKLVIDRISKTKKNDYIHQTTDRDELRKLAGLKKEKKQVEETDESESDKEDLFPIIRQQIMKSFQNSLAKTVKSLSANLLKMMEEFSKLK